MIENKRNGKTIQKIFLGRKAWFLGCRLKDLVLGYLAYDYLQILDSDPYVDLFLPKRLGRFSTRPPQHCFHIGG